LVESAGTLAPAAPEKTHAAYNGHWFWSQPTLDELRQDFRRTTRGIRPDCEVPR
jgi:hypothetical protein